MIHFTLSPAQVLRMEEERWAEKLAQVARCRLYGSRPEVGKHYIGRDGDGWKVQTSTVKEAMRLNWAVGFIGGEDIRQWWIIQTRNSAYIVAELKA